ncbi:MAG: RHS repeat-associated core domain-containing protein [Gemmatimonadetes bacterium]|nr:RHS repeat-associated core domain-containing protein [Gemmatimonadota bacterium]
MNGTVRGLARLRTGAKVKEYAEAPWGDAVADTGVVVRYRFAGREYDSESGLYYMRARYYDPALGRWISEDPIGVEGGHNLFGYSGNDPVNVVDPWGLDPLCGEGWVQIVTRGVDENGVPTWDLKCEKAGGAGNGGFIGPGTGRNAPPGSSFPHRPAGPRGRGAGGPRGTTTERDGSGPRTSTLRECAARGREYYRDGLGNLAGRAARGVMALGRVYATGSILGRRLPFTSLTQLASRAPEVWEVWPHPTSPMAGSLALAPNLAAVGAQVLNTVGVLGWGLTGGEWVGTAAMCAYNSSWYDYY